MLLLFEKSIGGGMCNAIYNYEEANKKLMKIMIRIYIFIVS